jgi:hypothetical protein
MTPSDKAIACRPNVHVAAAAASSHDDHLSSPSSPKPMFAGQSAEEQAAGTVQVLWVPSEMGNQAR